MTPRTSREQRDALRAPFESAERRYEYKVDGLGDEWRESAVSQRWADAIDASLDLLTVTEVAFTIGDPDVSTVVIRYRKAQT
jgi:hypothetical protein